MLERSRAASLFLIWRYGSDKSNAAFYKALQHIDRVVRLDVAAPLNQNIFSLSILDRLVKPAPLLRTLHLSTRTPTTDLVLLPCVLGGHTPLLTHLVVDGPFFAWDSMLWRNNLTTLKVIHSSGTSNLIPSSFRDFLLALSYMPDLQELELHHSLPPRPLHSSTSQMIPLPNLRSLRLSGACAADINNLTNHITFPRRPIYLDFYGVRFSNGIQDGCGSVVSSLQTIFSSANNNLFTFLWVTSTHFEAWSCTCSNISHCFAYCHPKQTFCRIHFVIDHFHLQSFETIIRSLPSNGVRSLWLDANTTEQWIQMGVFRRMKSLTAIKMSGVGAIEVVKAFWAIASDADEKGRITFPSLEEVEIHTVCFDALLSQLFENSLRKRLGHHRGIQRAIFRHCKLDREILGQIGALVEVDTDA
ncbi:hypothetical protein AAF712_009723 [Marasmius tenuissimus]|uniref:Uncharacterized protein n=1 Tax=Marasmius tenuissimus TaxID=585030 RepID=A0ABR2ZRC6_9AGAR